MKTLARRIVIRPAAIADCDAVAARLHPDDAAEVAAVVDDPRQAVRRAFRASLVPPKVALVDGQVAAVWGLRGHMFPNVGEPWLLTTPAIERIALHFMRVARREIATMLAIKPRLENYVAANHAKAIRLLEGLGFRLDRPTPIGPRRALFRRYWIEV